MKQLVKLVKFLNSNSDPRELALGAVFALFAALLSVEPLNFILVFILLLFVRANISFFLLCGAIIKVFSYALDPVSDAIGFALLTAAPLYPFWNFLASVPLLPYTGFNNSVVAGSFVLAMLLAAPVWIGAIKFVAFYRNKMQAGVEKFKIVQAFKATKFFGMYMKGE